MSYVSTYARPLGGDVLTDFTCADPNSTKIISKDKAGCFCRTGYACTTPEDPFFGCMDGWCMQTAQAPVDPSVTLAQQACEGAGLTWDPVNSKCLQGSVTPQPTPGGGGGAGPGPMPSPFPQPQPVPAPAPPLKAGLNTQDLWLAVIVGGLVIGMVMMSKPAPRRAR